MSMRGLMLRELDPFDIHEHEIFADKDNHEIVRYSFKGSKSKTSTDKSTKVTTTTTTNIGDIGLTGRNAVEMAAILSKGVELTTRAVGDIIVPVTNAFAVASRAREETARASLAPKTIAAESGKSPGQLVGENLPLIALGLATVVLFRGFAK